MANSYYNATHNPPTGGSLSSQQIREEFLLVEAAFDGIGDGPAVAELWATSMVPFPGSDGMKGARAYAQDAAASATTAQGRANDAETLYQEFRGTYYGALSADPELDPNGGACTVGDWYTNTVTGGIRLFDGSLWGNPLSGATLNTFIYTAAGSETSLSGPDDNTNTLAYTVGFLVVYLNGARLTPGDEYTADDGTSITDLSALSENDVVVIDAFSPFEVGEQALLPENNLNDVDDAATARTNLGLGAAAVLGEASVANIRAGTGTGLVSSEDITASLAEVTLTDASTVAVDGSTFINARLTMGGNRTLGNMTNAVVGRTYRVIVLSDGATERTLTLDSQYIAGEGVDLMAITNVAGERRELAIYAESSSSFIVRAGAY